MSDNNRPSAELVARVALESQKFRHSHALGQNFILSENLLNALLDAAEIQPEDCVLEIGPGAGVMTRLLSRRASKVLAVELDQGLKPVLDQVLEGCDNVRVVFQDFMKADVAALTRETFGGAPFRVVANLPYYITADILLKLATGAAKPESIAIMVQKEAAERVMSEPGDKQWCALAATLRYFYWPQVLLDVPADAFDPPPHVQSCFLRLNRYEQPPVIPADEKAFLKLITCAFAMRRKTLVNNLKAGFGLSAEAACEVLRRAGVDERARGESLSMEQLCAVADALCALRNDG